MFVKLRKISEITATLPFTEFDFMQKYRESFAVSELGRIHAQLPLKKPEHPQRSGLFVPFCQIVQYVLYRILTNHRN